MADQLAEYEQLGEKRLKLADAVAQSVGFMGPVFSAALILPLIVANLSSSGKGAGVATPIAVILATIGVAAIGWIIAAYARRIHAAGALYDYVSHGFGERAGFIAGWVYYWGTMGLTVAIPLGIGGITYGLLHDDIGWKGTPAYWIIGLVYIGVLYLLLYSGVRISTRVQLTLVLVSATVVLAFFLYIIAKGGASGNSIKPFQPSSSADGWSGIFYGILYGILIFVGFETAANLGEETANPKRSIPRAILLSVFIVGGYYVIASYAQDIGFGLNAKAWASNPAPLFSLGAPAAAGGFGSVSFDRLLQVLVILDMAAVGLGCGVCTTRGVFAMARDRRIPGLLAGVSARRGTPVAATVLTVAVGVVIDLWTRVGHGVLPTGGGPYWFPMFVWLAGLGAFALALVYATISLGAIRGLWDSENRTALVIAGVLGFLVSAGAIYGSIYKVPHPANKVPWVTLIFIVTGILMSLGVKGRQRAVEVIPELSEAGAGGGSPVSTA